MLLLLVLILCIVLVIIILIMYRLPKAACLKISPDLQNYCQNNINIKKSAPNNSEIVQLIKSVLCKLMGVSSENIHLPLANTDVQQGKPLSVGIGLAPLAPKRFRNGSVGNNLSGMSIPPPPPLMKRTKSVGVNQVYDDSSMDLHDSISSGEGGHSTSLRDGALCLCPNEDNQQVKTGLLLVTAGQSILDVDSIPGCYVIISGRVSVQFQGLPANHSGASRPEGAERSLPFLGRSRVSKDAIYEEGEVLGQISLLLGNSSEWYGRCDNNLASPAVLVMTALVDTCLLKVPMMSYEQVVSRNPEVIFTLAHMFVAELPPIIRLFDFCTKWIKLSGGENIVKRGEKATGKLHIVVFGRVRMIVGDGKSKHHHTSPGSDERQHYVMGRGTLVGDSQLLVGGTYQHTVKAIRQTMLSEISESLLHFLADKYPTILTHIARNVSDRHQLSQIGSPPSKSFLVLPISSSAPVYSFTSTLKRCFAHCANKVNLVTSNDVRVIFDTILDGLSDHEYILTVGNWLHQIEMDSDIVIYQADIYFSTWNELCLIRTDEILLLANAADYNEGVQMKRMEYSILRDSTHIPKTLVLTYINPPPYLRPRGTRDWIEAREGINRHAHVRLHINTNFEYDTMHYSSDCNRLARILTNNAVGVVLGGGGARGIAHLGVLQALEESGIPVDIVGGTSIGAFIGGCYAKENAFMSIFPTVKAWAQISSSYWFYIMDLTFPITSYFNGSNFTKSIADIFRDDKIEDFWINYYCITTGMYV
jgi:CRP-like cAMP-binding protein